MKKLLLLLTLFTGVLGFSQTWVTQNTGFTAPSRGISELSIVDANTVWCMPFDGSGAAANVQEFTRTSNGGTTWTAGTVNVGNTALRLSNISAVSATTAWAGAFDNTNGLGGVWKTTNGGVTWTQQNAGAYTTAGASWFNWVHFFDANNGVTMGDPGPATDFEVFYTSDGGATWTAPNALQFPNPLANEYGYNGGFTVAGTTIWFVTSSGRIFKSTNMGVNWTVSQSPIADFGGTASSGFIRFSDANNGILKSSATTNNFYTTTNGGATWSAASTFTGAYPLLSYVPGTSTLVGTSAGTPSGSAYSNNNGTTWIPIDSGTQRGQNAFFNGSTGWCGGYNTNATTGGIFKLNGNLAVQNVADIYKVTLSPNPTNGIVNINGAEVNEVNVTDLLGKTVFTKKLNAITNPSIDLSSLQTGTYLLTASSDKGASTIKFIKN
jgi:hypothetical protein